MKTIAERWAEFAANVLPASAPAAQRVEMRRAFYAGFESALTAGLDIADESGDSDDIGATMFQRLHDECQQFAAAVAAGHA